MRKVYCGACGKGINKSESLLKTTCLPIGVNSNTWIEITLYKTGEDSEVCQNCRKRIIGAAENEFVKIMEDSKNEKEPEKES